MKLIEDDRRYRQDFIEFNDKDQDAIHVFCYNDSGRIGMLTYCNNLSVKDYCDLRTSVGWPYISDDQAQSGLDNSDFIISCVDEGKTVGCARIFWDKGYIAYLADVIVNPEYQGQGIGKKMVQECIKYIDNQLKEGWRIKIVIVASKGKEAFYEKLGFKARPNDNDGPGMDMWRE